MESQQSQKMFLGNKGNIKNVGNKFSNKNKQIILRAVYWVFSMFVFDFLWRLVVNVKKISY